MTFITVGSTAMAAAGIGNRVPKDWDIFTHDNGLVAALANQDPDLRIEAFWHPDLANHFSPTDHRTATVDEQYTIKVSHSYWSLRNGSWEKHMYDQEQLRRAGGILIPDFHSILYGIWAGRYGAKQVNLSQDSAAFFGPGIRRRYNHDSVHQAVAYGQLPMYTQILKPGSEVEVSMPRLRALSHSNKLLLWREEAAVLALERSLIPAEAAGAHAGHQAVNSAWLSALKTLITSATKGESALWLSQHYHELRRPDNFHERFHANGHLLRTGD